MELRLTAGKFLSYLGYESFYQISDNMISLADQALLSPIPGYHEGVKMDYAPDKADTLGVAVVDSLYQKPGYNATEGDGDFKHNAGFEGYYTYTGVTNLQIWAGAGFETTTKPGVDSSGVTEKQGTGVTVLDLWGTYTLDKAGDQIAVEEDLQRRRDSQQGLRLADLLPLQRPELRSQLVLFGEGVSGARATRSTA